MDSLTIRIDADAALDSSALHAAPATVIVRLRRNVRKSCDASIQLLWIGQTSNAPPLTSETRLIDRRGCVLLPGLVNAHTHLDLTHIGPRAYDPSAGFLGFVRTVLGERLSDERAIRSSIERGVELSRRGGVVAVGDIGGVAGGKPTLAPWRALRESGMMGVSYLEFFAMGEREQEQIRAMREVLQAWEREEDDRSPVRMGIQPHATYTASERAFMAAIHESAGRAPAMPLCTHLAENIEEHELIERGTGPFRGFLERAGMWNADVERGMGLGQSPAGHMRSVLRSAPFLCAHVNDASDADIELLASSGASVVYCPRSSAYFRNHESFGPHRYRDMLRGGVNVCLGTDSIINLPAGSDNASEGRISTLDEARFLLARDGFDPRDLLAMCTTRGARALGLDDTLFNFNMRSGETTTRVAGVVCLPLETFRSHSPWESVLDSSSPPELLVDANSCTES